jgi:hypothetical protein
MKNIIPLVATLLLAPLATRSFGRRNGLSAGRR